MDRLLQFLRFKKVESSAPSLTLCHHQLAKEDTPEEITTFGNYIPEEIREHILLKLLTLPVKSLLKFRCVSKHYNYLISSPQFAKSHLEIAPRCQLLICEVDDSPGLFNTVLLPPNINNGTVERVPFSNSSIDLNHIAPFRNHGNPTNIIGSCNGLVCLDIAGYFVLWNPSIRKSRVLFKCSFPKETFYRSGGYVAYGFGYDISNADYKIVRHIYKRMHIEDQHVLEIYSLSDNLWRPVAWTNASIEDVSVNDALYVPRNDCSLGSNGVFLNGNIHLLVLWCASTHLVMLAINMVNESCTVMSLPSYDYDGYYALLGASEQHLFVSYFYYPHLDVWILKEYTIKESWTKFLYVPNITLQRSVEEKSWTTGFNSIFNSMLTGGGKLQIMVLGNREIFLKSRSKGEHAFKASPLLENYLSSDQFIRFGCTTYVESFVSSHL